MRRRDPQRTPGTVAAGREQGRPAHMRRPKR